MKECLSYVHSKVSNQSWGDFLKTPEPIRDNRQPRSLINGVLARCAFIELGAVSRTSTTSGLCLEAAIPWLRQSTLHQGNNAMGQNLKKSADYVHSSHCQLSVKRRASPSLCWSYLFTSTLPTECVYVYTHHQQLCLTPWCQPWELPQLLSQLPAL